MSPLVAVAQFIHSKISEHAGCSNVAEISLPNSWRRGRLVLPIRTQGSENDEVRKSRSMT